jgi:hypothetical protein
LDLVFSASGKGEKREEQHARGESGEKPAQLTPLELA